MKIRQKLGTVTSQMKQTGLERDIEEEEEQDTDEYGDEDGDKDVVGPEELEAATGLAESLIEQILSGRPFDSRLLAYLAMLSVKKKKDRYHDLTTYNSSLSGILYCVQLWIFRLACREADKTTDGESEGRR